jgi:hypothetical protein
MRPEFGLICCLAIWSFIGCSSGESDSEQTDLCDRAENVCPEEIISCRDDGELSQSTRSKLDCRISVCTNNPSGDRNDIQTEIGEQCLDAREGNSDSEAGSTEDGGGDESEGASEEETRELCNQVDETCPNYIDPECEDVSALNQQQREAIECIILRCQNNPDADEESLGGKIREQCVPNEDSDSG